MSEPLEKRKELLKNLIQRLHDGEDQERVKLDFARDFGAIPARELSQVEQALIEDGMSVDEITRLCDVHAAVFADSILASEITPPSSRSGHPASVFAAENRGLADLLEKKLRPAAEARDWQALSSLWTELRQVEGHYAKKETLLFPLLEKHGVYGPPKVMWNVDDEIRALLREVGSSLESGAAPDTGKLEEALSQIGSMIEKENKILLPMLEEHLTADEWLLVASESEKSGYVFLDGSEGDSPADAADWTRRHLGLSKEEAPAAVTPNGEIHLPSGQFSSEELTALLNSLPFDLSFIGADDRVRFFSETKDRIFLRSRTILGREVQNCHPPKSLAVVEKLIKAFKDGSKDSESFWIRKGELLILIRYYAVRDGEGRYLGVVELTEDIAPWQELQGEKTLLSDDG